MGEEGDDERGDEAREQIREPERVLQCKSEWPGKVCLAPVSSISQSLEPYMTTGNQGCRCEVFLDYWDICDHKRP